MEKPFYTLQELARLLSVNEMSVRRLVKKHALPFYKIGGVYRFRVEEVETWLQLQRGELIKGKDHEDHDHEST